METIQCSHCQREFDHQLEQCPHCGTPVPIPNYPRFSGGGAFMTMWIFFVILVIILLVTMFSI